jgi:hypothetical protein
MKAFLPRHSLVESRSSGELFEASRLCEAFPTARIRRKPLALNRKRSRRSLEFVLRSCLYSHRFPGLMVGNRR